MKEKYAQILALETEVPSGFLSQNEYISTMARLMNLDEVRGNLLNRIAAGTKIEKRHFVARNVDQDGNLSTFLGLDKATTPTTGQRNLKYKELAPHLASSVCRKTLDRWGGDRGSITHVISVSCTGMVAPGIEFLLIKQLGLSSHVERLGINFMGCFGAFKGLAVAKAIALESPKNRVLVVCTELCSLHVQDDLNADTLVANSLFADGAAAVIIGMDPREGENPLFELHLQKSEALEETLELMSWETGDTGYQMRLSSAVPKHIEKSVSSFTESLIGPDRSIDQCAWAVHPGGRAILEGIANACGVQQDQFAASWNVLREYGNMSSPTFLFVLKELLKTKSVRDWVIGLGFGPGLSCEGMLLKRVDANVAG